MKVPSDRNVQSEGKLIYRLIRAFRTARAVSVHGYAECEAPVVTDFSKLARIDALIFPNVEEGVATVQHGAQTHVHFRAVRRVADAQSFFGAIHAHCKIKGEKRRKNIVIIRGFEAVFRGGFCFTSATC